MVGLVSTKILWKKSPSLLSSQIVIFIFYFFFGLYVLPSESLLSFGDSWFLCYLINIGFKTKLYCIKMRRFSRDFSITIKEKRFFFLQNKIKYTNNFNFYLLMVRKYHSFETRLTRQNPVKNPIATRWFFFTKTTPFWIFLK
jgi:hypothetical protein